MKEKGYERPAVSLTGGLRATAVLAFVVFLTARPLPAQENDRAQLLRIKAAFELDASQSKLNLLLPYLGDDFEEQMFFQQFQGKDRLKDLLAETMGGLGRTNEVQRYEIEIIPTRHSLKLAGGRASASGTTQEMVKTPLGEVVCRSKWTATFQRRDGRWVLSQMDSILDPADPVAMAVAKLVRHTRDPFKRLILSSPKIAEPNYDGDTGLMRKDTDSLPASDSYYSPPRRGGE